MSKRNETGGMGCCGPTYRGLSLVGPHCMPVHMSHSIPPAYPLNTPPAPTHPLTHAKLAPPLGEWRCVHRAPV